MKQKVSVYVLVKSDKKALLLRRAVGRSDIVGKYELPGGELPFGSTAESAADSFFSVQTGVTLEFLQLLSVNVYMSEYDTQTQRVDIVFLATLSSGARIVLSSRHDKYDWKSTSELQQSDMTEALHHAAISSRTEGNSSDWVSSEGTQKRHHTVASAKEGEVVIYADGGSRGNPGPSAAGFIIYDNDERVIEEGGAYLGITTNNQAEYHGVRLALEAASRLSIRRVQFRLDSLMVVNQLKGAYTVKNRDLWPIHEHIKVLIARFEKVAFTHVRREFNQAADKAVNRILDEHASGRSGSE